MYRSLALVLAGGLLVPNAGATIVEAKCGPLQGPRVDYQDFYKSGKPELKTGEDHFGERTYVWDSSKPDVLQELQRVSADDGTTGSSIKVHSYPIVKATNGAIVAVENQQSAIYTHTFWPELKFLVMMRISAQTSGAVGAMYYAKCVVNARE